MIMFTYLLCFLPKVPVVAVLLGKLKGKISYFLRKEFWLELKSIVTRGEAPLAVIKNI